jgi:hypothetical protein
LDNSAIKISKYPQKTPGFLFLAEYWDIIKMKGVNQTFLVDWNG